MMQRILFLLIPLGFLFACQQSQVESNDNNIIKFQNKGHELVFEMVQKVGNYDILLDKKNVKYTYTYTTSNNETDISKEVYFFDEELSYGYYEKHEKTFPQLQGIIEQGFDGKEYWLKNAGKVIEEESLLKTVAFKRPTNFYWFTMFQKLLDPGLNYEHLGEEVIENKNYDIVRITFESKSDKPTDIYQLYINKNTSLVDQFLFTVADFGKMDIPNLMKLEYEEVEGILIPTKRLYKKSTWNADVSELPWIMVSWSDIQFNVDITKEDFKVESNMRKNVKASLKASLEKVKEDFEHMAGDDKKRAFKECLESIKNSGVTQKAIQVGDKAPNFTLKNAMGEPVTLSDYLKKGKVILTWYLGGWCPYCNYTLQELNDELPYMKAHGANLIALTPELPDKSMSTAEKHDLEYEILSDINKDVARDYGIVYKLTDEVAEIYKESFDLSAYNGDDSNELPLTATYIIDTDGTVIYAFLDADYRNRAEPSELTEIIMAK